MAVRSILLMVLVGVIGVSVKAQDRPFPNEIAGFEFSKMDRVKDLRLLVSTKDDVIARFGPECVNGCAFSEDWEISFAYVNSGWSRTETTNGITSVFRPRAQFVDRLSDINFKPRRPIILPEKLEVPGGLACDNATTTRGTVKFKSVICSDESRLAYYIYNEDNKQEKFQRYQLFQVIYTRSAKQDEEMFGLDSLAAK